MGILPLMYVNYFKIKSPISLINEVIMRSQIEELQTRIGKFSINNTR